jgi:hypothetical protein
VYFQPELPIRVETDALGYAISAILSQPYRDGPKGTKWKPIAFFSRKMIAAERNYDMYNGELLAIIEVFKAWRYYLEGSQHKIKIYTDHKNLCWFLSTKHLTQRQVR